MSHSQYEYHFLIRPYEMLKPDEINHYLETGGWELFSITYHSSNYNFYFYLKRVKQS